jgi:iron uptake system EfeUOB component EfeO/EfeM
VLCLASLTTVTLAACEGGHAVTSAQSPGPRPTALPIVVLAAACAPGWQVKRGGPYAFKVTNRTRSTERVTLKQTPADTTTAQLDAIDPGASATLTALLSPGGSYRWQCTHAGRHGPQLSSVAARVPDAATRAVLDPPPLPVADLVAPLRRYTAYVERMLTRLRAQVSTMRGMIAARSASAAKAQWLAAHRTWLMIGQDDGGYGAFGALGQAIDGSADGLAGGTANRGFTGFHRVELELWRRDDLAAAGRDSAALSRLLARLTPQAVAADLPTTAVALNSWVLRCHEILEDAQRDSLSADDDYGSHTDLVALTADVHATREMLRVLGPLITPLRPHLVATAERELTAIDSAATAVRNGTHTAIAAIPSRQRQRIDATTDAALQTLAPVSELMQSGNS